MMRHFLWKTIAVVFQLHLRDKLGAVNRDDGANRWGL